MPPLLSEMVAKKILFYLNLAADVNINPMHNKRRKQSAKSRLFICWLWGADLGLVGGFKYINKEYPQLPYDIVLQMILIPKL